MKYFLFLLILLSIPPVSAVTCEVSPTSTTIDLGLSKKVTVSCSGWDVNSVIVEPTQYNAACLSLDKSSDTLTSGASTKDFTVTATSMACQESINDRTIIWRFTPSSGTVPSKSTTVTIQSGLTITATFKNAPYSATAGDEVNIILEVSTTANENITGITVNVSGSSSTLVSAGLTEKSVSKIAASSGEKTQQVSWTITAPSAGTYNINATVTSTNADSDTAGTTLTTTAAGSDDDKQTTTSGGGGGGGGGGLVAPPLEAPSESYESITKYIRANEKTIISVPSESQELTGITEIEALLDRTVRVSATVSKVSALPSGTPEPEGKLYSYFEIVFTEFGTVAKVEPSGSIKYRVSKDWLNSQGAKPSDVQFLKFKEGKWIELESELFDEDDKYYNFNLNLNSFSLFAVVTKKKVYLPAISFPTTPETEEETPEETQTTTPEQVATQPVTVKSTTSGEIPVLSVAGGLLIAIAAIVAVFLLKRKR